MPSESGAAVPAFPTNSSKGCSVGHRAELYPRAIDGDRAIAEFMLIGHHIDHEAQFLEAFHHYLCVLAPERALQGGFAFGQRRQNERPIGDALEPGTVISARTAESSGTISMRSGSDIGRKIRHAAAVRRPKIPARQRKFGVRSMTPKESQRIPQ